MTLEVSIEELELLEHAVEHYRAPDLDAQAAEDLLDWVHATQSAGKRVVLGSPTPPPAPLETGELAILIAALERYAARTMSRLRTRTAARRAAAKDRAAKMLAEVAVNEVEERHRTVTALLDRARTLLATADRPHDVASNASAPRVTNRKHPRTR